ncbi:hypothetical protein Hanom_Chr03g00247711 [Helianthus anomalus]
MAFVQMKMVATAIIYHYHVELVEGHNVRASDSILLQLLKHQHHQPYRSPQSSTIPFSFLQFTTFHH